jgi:hypothetical protein
MLFPRDQPLTRTGQHEIQQSEFVHASSVIDQESAYTRLILRAMLSTDAVQT